MAAIWERGLRRMCARWAKGAAWTTAAVADRKHLWDDVGKDRWLTADVLVRHRPSGERMVLDAKYKHEFGREGRGDRFQMAAYVLAFRARVAVLVYPTATEVESLEARTLLRSELVPGGATILSMELPMAAGPGGCERAAAVLLLRLLDLLE